MINCKIIYSPISERYWSPNCDAQIDPTTDKIRCGGAWFDYDDRWEVVRSNEDLVTYLNNQITNGLLCKLLPDQSFYLHGKNEKSFIASFSVEGKLVTYNPTKTSIRFLNKIKKMIIAFKSEKQ